MTIKNFAEQLSEALLAVADAKVVEKAVIEAAEDFKDPQSISDVSKRITGERDD